MGITAIIKILSINNRYGGHFGGSGGAEGNRTPDLLIANEALSHLSYSPAVPVHFLAEATPCYKGKFTQPSWGLAAISQRNDPIAQIIG